MYVGPIDGNTAFPVSLENSGRWKPEPIVRPTGKHDGPGFQPLHHERAVRVVAAVVRGRQKDLSPVRVGAEVTGMTACPCAQNIMKERAMRVLEGLDVSNSRMGNVLHA